MTDRYIVLGDNHGDTASLRHVLDDADGDSFDYAVHVGDFTRAWRTGRQEDDEQLGKRRGGEQLRAVEPLLERLDERAEHGLLWVYGNQDYFGDLPYDLTVGTEIPDDGCVTVGGQRFTNSPSAVAPDVVLVTHVEKWSLIDHFEGRAHFCGNTHRGRHRDRRLNSAFLKLTDPEDGETTYGGYFVVEVSESGPLDVECRPIGDLERRECDRHGERGVQFQPSTRDCMYCRDQRVLMREMSASAFYGLTVDTARTAVDDERLVAYAVELWNDPPEGFESAFEAYLADIETDRYAPLARTNDGQLTVAEQSYAY
jgi:hypothetical protein